MNIPKKIDTKHVHTVIIPLCFGHPDNDMGCMHRLLKPLEYIDPLKLSEYFIIQTGGYEKKSPRKPTFLWQTSLCEAMHKKLKLEHPLLAERFFWRACGWGTRSEIRNAFRIIVQEGIATRTTPIKIVISSHKIHLRRIKWYVDLHKPEKWDVSYIAVEKPFGVLNTLREILALPVEIFKDSIYYTCVRMHLAVRVARQAAIPI
jgi:hypothetical protein